LEILGYFKIIVFVFLKDLICSSSLHLFDQNTGKNVFKKNLHFTQSSVSHDPSEITLKSL